MDRKALWLGAAAWFVLAGAASAQQAAGDWHGTLATPAGELRTVLKIKSAAAGFEGVMLSPDQSANELALSDIKLDGQTLTFAVPQARGAYAGRWDAQARAWTGTWTQAGRPLPLAWQAGDLPKGAVIEGLDGDWAGELAAGSAKLRLVLHVRTGPYGTVGTLDSLDQLAMGMPTTLTRDGAKIGFAVKAAGLAYEGVLNGDTISGSTTQANRVLPLVLTRREAAAAPRARAQTPAPPFPYAVQEVRIPSAPGVTLAGTLTLPPGDKPVGAVVMITGSGPQDRDETIAGHKPFAVIADALTRRGVAVLRYDDRGVGQSTGEFAKAGLEDFGVDAAAALDWLSKQPRIDARRIGLLGHSEGALVAPMVATKDSRAAFLVLIGAPAAPLGEVLQAQRAALAPHMGLGPGGAARSQTMFDHAMAAMQGAASDTEAQQRAAAVFLAEGKDLGMTPQSAAAAAQVSSGWFRGLISYDPAPALRAVKVPILAVTGSKDLQVLADQNLPALRAATRKNRDVTAVALPNLNHLLQTATTGAVGEYADIAETVAPSALKLIGDWVAARTPR